MHAALSQLGRCLRGPASPAPASFANSRWPCRVHIAGSGCGYSLVVLVTCLCAVPGPPLALRWAGLARYAIRVSRTHLLHVLCLTVATDIFRRAALHDAPIAWFRPGGFCRVSRLVNFHRELTHSMFADEQVATPPCDHRCTAPRYRSPATRIARCVPRPAPTATRSRCLRRQRQSPRRRRAAGRRARSTAWTTGASASSSAAAACDSPGPQSAWGQQHPIVAATSRGVNYRERERA